MSKSSISKFIPNEYKKDVYSIDFYSLKEKGMEVFFFDLDNTLADYETHHASVELINFINNVKTFGRVILVSNNHKTRVTTYMNELDVEGIYDVCKPFVGKIKKYIKNNSIELSKCVWIGDQVMTDLKVTHKLNIYSILVDPLKEETERWYTRINRYFERKRLNQIKKEFQEVYESLNLEDRNGR